MVTKVEIETERPPLVWFLERGAQKAEAEEEPFATFTRPIARRSPPTDPAGYDQASDKAKARWKGDAYRVQPYQYEDRNLVTDKHGPRRPLPSEQLRMMGFASNHLEAKVKLSNDVKGQLIGNSFSAIAVARLLVGLVASDDMVADQDVTSMLWQCWHEMEERAQHDEQPWKVRFGSLAGSGTMVRSLRELVVGPVVTGSARLIDPRQWMTDEQVLSYLLTRAASHRGGEIRVSDGAPMAVGAACRQSVDPTHWVWKVLLSHQWKEPGQHINVLETAAVLDVLCKLCRDSKHHNRRYVILIDNQTALSALAKGRSSARALQNPLRRIGAILIAGGVVLHPGWVKSKWNPADGPSRWGAPPRDAPMAPKQVLARRSPRAGKKERRELGSLQSLVVAPRTLTRYFEAVSLFLEFLQLHDYPYPSTFLLLDGRVCEYIEYLWQNGESKALHLIV